MSFTLHYHFEDINLDAIVKELSKPIWWISVVFAGIVINLLSAYIKSQIDKTFIGTLSWWREKSTERQKQWVLRIDAIISNKEIQADEMHREIVQRLQSITLMLIAIILLIFSLNISDKDTQLLPFASLILLGISALAFFESALALFEASTTSSVLEVAQKKLNYLSIKQV